MSGRRVKPLAEPVAGGQVWEHEPTGGVYLVLRENSQWNDDKAWRCLVLVEDQMWSDELPGSTMTARDHWLATACKRLA